VHSSATAKHSTVGCQQRAVAVSNENVLACCLARDSAPTAPTVDPCLCKQGMSKGNQAEVGNRGLQRAVHTRYAQQSTAQHSGLLATPWPQATSTCLPEASHLVQHTYHARCERRRGRSTGGCQASSEYSVLTGHFSLLRGHCAWQLVNLGHSLFVQTGLP